MEHLDQFEARVAAGESMDAAIETVRAETSVGDSLRTMIAGLACAMQATGSPYAVALSKVLIERTQDMVAAVVENTRLGDLP